MVKSGASKAPSANAIARKDVIGQRARQGLEWKRHVLLQQKVSTIIVFLYRKIAGPNQC